LKVRAWLRAFGRRRSAASTENTGKNVAKATTSAAARGLAACAPSFEEIGKVEAAKIEISSLRTSRAALRHSPESARAGRASSRIGFCCSRIDIVGIKAELIVNLALLGIAQNVVSFRNGLELFFCGLVAGIYVRMVLAGKLTKRLANILR